MKNIVIFGGAFDPVHNGHLNMAVKASKTLDAEVFFVPARISVWKNKTAPIEDKINMLNLAIKSIGMEEKLKVSRIEADSKNDTNYTIDTVKKFKQLYPDSNLFLLIGLDQVNSFHLWKDASEFPKYCQIIYYERNEEQLNNDNILKFQMRKISGETCDASSTDIRTLQSIDTPYPVIEYIINNELYFVKNIKQYLTPDRYIHSASVAKLSYEIAEANNLSIKGDCFIAGLLHDIGKKMPMVEQTELMNKHFPQYASINPKIYHQFIGFLLAKNDFNIKNINILNAIMYHTTGRANMTDIEKIVYAADKLDPNRGFDGSSLINSLKVNLNDGFIATLIDNKRYFIKNNISFDNELTNSCIDFYLK